MFAFPETILNCLCLNIVSLVLFSVFNQESDDDRDVVRQAVKGNRRRSIFLWKSTYKKIYNLAYRFVGMRRRRTT